MWIALLTSCIVHTSCCLPLYLPMKKNKLVEVRATVNPDKGVHDGGWVKLLHQLVHPGVTLSNQFELEGVGKVAEQSPVNVRLVTHHLLKIGCPTLLFVLRLVCQVTSHLFPSSLHLQAVLVQIQ